MTNGVPNVSLITLEIMNTIQLINQYPLNVFTYEVQRMIENSWECHQSYVYTVMVNYQDAIEVMHAYGLSIGDAVGALIKLTN